MRPTFRITAIDWPELVRETIRRRKREGLTQKQHAELAGVSVPVVVAFDKGEMTMSVSRALAIMNVVGLADTLDSDRLTDWMVSSRMWFEDMLDREKVPGDSAARFPNGYWEAGYVLDDLVETISPKALLVELLPKAYKASQMTGWRPFWVPTLESIRPWIDADGNVVCWLGDPKGDRVFNDPAHSDFWRASDQCELFITRGYQEDSLDSMEHGKFMDIMLPIIRATEVLEHANAFASLAYKGQGDAVSLSMEWTGLSGRDLVSWANPRRIGPEPGEYVARAEKAASRTEFSTKTYPERRTELILELIHPLYSRFGFFDMQPETIESILKSLER